jgi:hypothetical protein
LNVPPIAAGGPALTVTVTTLLPLEPPTPELLPELLLLLELLLLELPPKPPLLELLLVLEPLPVELPLELEPLGLPPPPPPPPQPAKAHRPSNTVQRTYALMPPPRY